MRLTPDDAALLGRYALDGRKHDHEPTKCPHCQKLWTQSTGRAGADLPRPGHFCVCFYCAGICQYDEAMGALAVSNKELQALPRRFRSQLEKLSATLKLALQATGGVN